MSKARLMEMFSRMVEAKDIDACPRYYHPQFVLETNGHTEGYAEFLEGHRRVYATPIDYAIRYDHSTWVESADRVAVRMWITVSRPGEAPRELEVILVATYRDGLIDRVVELTWPDWTKVAALDSYVAPPAGG